ncbi:hypothetical protein GCM10027030_05990 [Luteococcus sediminum]
MAEILGMAAALGIVSVVIAIVVRVVLALLRRSAPGRLDAQPADVHELPAVHPSDRMVRRHYNLAA